MTAGYCKRPLREKLGLEPGMRSRFLSAPAQYEKILRMRLRSDDAPLDFIQAFVKDIGELKNVFKEQKSALQKTGMIWICWPKKTATALSLFDENIVREEGLAAGLVDIKVCAIDDTWSGLKFVYRLRERTPS